MIDTQAGSLASQLRVMPTVSGHNVLLAGADYALYHLHTTRFFTHYRPEGQMESELVQRLADTEWRINRIARLEMALYAGGQLEFAALFDTADPNVQSLLLEAHTLKVYGRQLKDLALQESRLRRYFERDSVTLAELQSVRQDKEARQDKENDLHAPIAAMSQTVQAAPVFSQPADGFEFSTAPLEQTTKLQPATRAPQSRVSGKPNPNVSSFPS